MDLSEFDGHNCCTKDNVSTVDMHGRSLSTESIIDSPSAGGDRSISIDSSKCTHFGLESFQKICISFNIVLSMSSKSGTQQADIDGWKEGWMDDEIDSASRYSRRRERWTCNRRKGQKMEKGVRAFGRSKALGPALAAALWLNSELAS